MGCTCMMQNNIKLFSTSYEQKQTNTCKALTTTFQMAR